MGKRSKTAGGVYDSGNGNDHGYGHREHGHSSTPPWHRRGSGGVARRHHREDREHRGRAQFFGWMKPNRDRGERRRP